jgi:hypothetical protein
MAFIKRFIQRGIAKRRLDSEKETDRVKGALTLYDVGKEKTIEKLLPGLEDESWNVRNACALAIAEIYEREESDEIVHTLHEELKEASLIKKLAIIEALGKIGHDASREILLKFLSKSKSDLQYAIIIALSDWADLSLLPHLINVGKSPDYLTRRATMMTSYKIIADAIPNSTLEELLVYFQWIVQIYVETNYLGPLILKFLELPKEALKGKNFPVPLNEYEFSCLNELLDEADFDPTKYELLHEIAYPIMF